MGRTRGREIWNRGIAYHPLPSQARFHQSTARFKGFSGPIGSGKSQALCQEAIRLSYQNVGRLGLIGAPTYPMLRDATQATLHGILDNNRIPYEYIKAENLMVMRDTGSRILLRSVDEFERLRGTNLAWFGLDELTYTQEEAWLRLEGRLRDPKATHLCGFGVWTPKGYDWVHRRFISEAVDGYEVILAEPFENQHILERIPDFYERLRKSYDERFFQQEVLGEYINIQAHRVYCAFDHEANVKEQTLNWREPVLWTLDFNVEPMSSLIAQKDGDGLKVLDEIVLERATTMDACEAFRSRFPYHPAGVRVYGDASGHRMQTTGPSDYDVVNEFFRRNGYDNALIVVPKSNPSVRERVSLLNAMLKNFAGDVRLQIHPRCKELIKDFDEVMYKENSQQIDKARDPKRSHLSDALGYLVWREFAPRPVKREQGRMV